MCTTCITSATASLNVTDFPVVFLDEASMSTEPASLIPLMKGVCTGCVCMYGTDFATVATSGDDRGPQAAPAGGDEPQGQGGGAGREPVRAADGGGRWVGCCSLGWAGC